MAEVYCGSEPCPLFLNSTCVFYTGESLLYIGVQNNDTLEAIIVKINQAFQNAGVGYAFTNGLIQPTPFQPVQLGGALTQNTNIGGNFTLAFTGNVQAARHITTGGTSSQFVKGDGTLDSTAYQPAANYITGLSGDATASGPGVAAMTLATVNFASGTFGNGNTIPIVTVNAKGLVTNITPVPVTIPPLPLTFIGDVVGSGFTGSNISMLLQNVNANPYNTITPLKFTVNGKGLVTSASPITASDIVNILGYNPGTSGTSGSTGTSGTSGTTGTSGSSGTSATSGTSGTAGTSGTSATSGTSGTSGTDGTGGTSGTSGSTGTSGTAGTSGTSATSGTSGTTGSSGTSGTSGSTGTSGSSGTTGTSGSSGTTGTSGSSGTSGTTGTSGSSGTTGTSGTDGTGGTSGSSGTTGTSGSSGTSGTSATSGSSGTSGSTGTSGSSGLSGDRFKTTSTTTYTLQAPGATGTITVGLGLAYSVAQSIIIAYDANNHNEAEVTSYDPLTGSISFIVFRLTGSGTYSVWSVNIDGASGGDGSSGSSGTSGTSATAGTSGTTGSSGSSGTSGTTGTSGSSGSSGTSAIDGTNGTSGTAGTTGTSGSSGTSGTTGTSGSSGTSGTSATNGTGGTSGTSGSSGTSGTTGTSGTSATSGTSGTSATSGTTGTSGTSGTNGTGGTSGTSGSSATSGTSGTSGVNGAPGASGTSGTSGTSVAVSGTTNTMAKFTSATTIGNSGITDDGSTLTYTGQTVLNRQNSINVTTPGLTATYGLHFGGQTTADFATGITFSSGNATPTTANAGIYVQGSGAYGSRMYLATTDSYATGSRTAITINESGIVTINRNYLQSNTDLRAPIFYDSNNTAFYIDPSTSSVFNNSITTTSINGGLRVTSPGTATTQAAIAIQQVTGEGDTIIFADYEPYAEYGIIARNVIDSIDFTSGTTANSIDNYTITNRSGSARTAYVKTRINLASGITTMGDARAPIFYDSNNTSFYVDPASTSNLNGLNIGGRTALNTAYYPFHSNRDFPSGTLVQTTINYSASEGDPFILEITGNSYGNTIPFDIQVQGYIYANTIINAAGISNGTNISGVRAINFNGNLCFWWPYQSYWQGFNVKVYSAYATYPENRVTSISNSSQPTTSKQYDFAIYQSFHTANTSLFSSYDITFNRAYSNTDMRAPIFYDSNDTAYYIDGHNISSLNILNIGNGSGGNQRIVFKAGNDTSAYSALRFEYGGTERNTIHLFGPNWQSGSLLLSGGAINLSGYTGVTFGPWNVPVMWVDNSGNAQANGSMRAPIFFDSNNTGYYLDPASTSSLRTVGSWRSDSAAWDGEFNGKIQYHANSWYFQAAGDWLFRNSAGTNVVTINQSGVITGSLNGNATTSTNSTNTVNLVGLGVIQSTSVGTSYQNNYQVRENSGGGGNTNVIYAPKLSFHWAGVVASSILMEASGRMTIRNNPGTSYEDFAANISYAYASSRAPIFYDLDNTGYYLDPASGSSLNGVVSTNYITASNCNLAVTGLAGQITFTTNIGTFGAYWRATQHIVIENTSGGYHVYVLDSNGVGVVKLNGAQSWSAQSDGRIKTVHSTLKNNLSKLENITPIYYSFNNFDDDRNRIGLIAQEVQEHFPELVAVDPKTNYLNLDYTGLIPVLLGAIKELKTKVETLENKIS
jgi:hypothetical protein